MAEEAIRASMMSLVRRLLAVRAGDCGGYGGNSQRDDHPDRQGQAPASARQAAFI
jgi:hypothetical protein